MSGGERVLTREEVERLRAHWNAYYALIRGGCVPAKPSVPVPTTTQPPSESR